MFSTPETSVHVLDKNREISPLEALGGSASLRFISPIDSKKNNKQQKKQYKKLNYS